MSTTDQFFVDYIDSHFNSTMKNSTLISATAKKIRGNFFNDLLKKVELVEGNIHGYSSSY